MPLRNHTRPPYDLVPFDGVHGGWPMKMVENLFDQAPPNSFLAPQVQLGARLEYDLAAYQGRSVAAAGVAPSPSDGSGGVATLSPPLPTLDLECELPSQDEYEVRIHDRNRRLVATVEIVSPSNKDRPENRRAFVAKCAALLQQDVCVSIVDIVPDMRFNLYADLLELMGRSDPAMGEQPPAVYAATCRGDKRHVAADQNLGAHSSRRPAPSDSPHRLDRRPLDYARSRIELRADVQVPRRHAPG